MTPLWRSSNSSRALAWTKRFGGTSDDVANAVAWGPDGSVYTTGAFQGTVDFDPLLTTTFNLTAAGGKDVFVSQLDSAGDFLAAKKLGGTSDDIGYGLALTPDARLYVTGAFSNTADFDPGAGNYSLTTSVANSMFLVQLSTVSVSGRVWFDANGNGVQDTGETGFPGAVAVAYRSTDSVIGDADDVAEGVPVITDANGNYTLTGLTDGGQHYVVFRPPVGYTFTGMNIGGNDALDSDADSTGRTGLFTLTLGQAGPAQDAGLVGSAPTFGMGLAVGGTSNAASMVYGQATAVDASGNVYVTGSLTSNSADFDPGPGSYRLSSAYATSGFVAKYTAGGALVWAASFAGTNFTRGYALAVGTDRSVVTTGRFVENADFDPGWGTYRLASSSYDVFVTKLDADGRLVWARQLGGTGTDYGYGLGLAADGSVYTTGSFTGTADFDPGAGTYNLTSAGSSDAFVSKLDAEGNFVWAKALGGTGTDVAYGLALGPDESVWTTGEFHAIADFDPGAGTANLTAVGDCDTFVSKLDAGGNYVWAGGLGGSGDLVRGRALTAAADGSLYVTGDFNGIVNFDPGAGVFDLTCPGLYSDVFVTKLSAAGGFVWARALGGDSDNVANSLVVAPDGSVITTGKFQGTADFDPGADTFALTALGGFRVFLSKLDAAGDFVWARTVGGDNGLGVALSEDGSLAATGTLLVQADLDPGPGTFFVGSGDADTDLFLHRFEPPRAPTQIALPANRVFEQQPVGTLVGGFVTTDADAAETFSYRFATGSGDADNNQFTILDSRLFTNAVFSVAAGSTYSIRVRATDSAGLWFEQPLTVHVVASADAASVGDLIWHDSNADGLQDAGEAGVGGAVAEVFSAGDNLSRGLAVTDGDGHYVLGGLLPGVSYLVAFRGPPGYTFAPTASGADATRDSDADAAGITLPFTLAAGQSRTDLDAGLAGAAAGFGWALSAGSAVGYDRGRDLVRDAAGNVFVVGDLEGTADFDPGPGTYSLTGQMYVAKYTAIGTLVWARSFTGSSTLAGKGLAVSSGGGVTAVGSFYGTADFDPGLGTFSLASAGSSDAFLVRLDGAGDFNWAGALGGTGSDQANAVAVAGDGSVSVTGYFSGTADLDPGAGTASATSTGGYDVFVAWLSAAGGFVWAKTWGGTLNDLGSDVALGPAGSVWSTGSFQETVDFDPNAGTANLTSAGREDVFVSQLTGNGDLVWAKHVGGSFSDTGSALTIGADGSLVLTGYFTSSADFDPGGGTATLTSAGGYDAFVTKWDPGGGYLWARRVGGTDDEFSTAVILETDGSVYAAGTFEGTADFDPGTDTFALTGAGGTDGWMLKLDAAGSFAWARRWGGISDDNFAGLAAAAGGGIYSTGSFTGAVDFDPTPDVALLASAGYQDMFVAKWLPPQGPTGLTLSLDRIVEQQPPGTSVGRLTGIDPDSLETFTFGLVNGAGSDDNSRFLIRDDRLVTNAVFDFAAQNVHHIRVRATDSTGLWWDQPLTITVVPAASAAAIGDLVWHDLDGNGVQDSGEPRVAGAVAEIRSVADGISRGVAITDAAGHYTLGQLLSGVDYNVVFRSPVGYSFTSQDAGTDDALDSDADASGATPTFQLAAGQNQAGWDAGLTGAAPSFGFALRAGTALGDSASAVAVDAAGSVLVAASVYPTADLDPGPSTYPVVGSGYSCAVLAKYTATGALVWAHSFAGASSVYGRNVTLGSDGSIFFMGVFQGTVDFDPGPGTVNLTSGGGTDSFVLKLDSNGTLVWAKNFGADNGLDLATGSDGSVFLTGSFTGTADFDPGAGAASLASAGGEDIFVAKLSAAGDYVWAKKIGSTSSDVASALAIASDGNIYMTGSFYGTVDFDPGAGSVNLTSAGLNDIFVAKLSAAGALVWAKRMGGSSNDGGRDLILAANDTVLTTGFFNGTVDFNPGSGTDNLTSAGSSDAFVSELSSLGNYMWAKRLGSFNSDSGSALALTPDGAFTFTGSFSFTVDMDPGTGTFDLTSSGSTDIFVCQWTWSGGFVWAKAMGGSSADTGSAIAVGADGSVYTAGEFLSGTADFDPGAGTFNLTSAGDKDLFLAKIANTGSDTPGITVNPTSGLVTTEAGGTATFTIVLNTQPTADVTIDLTSSDTTEGTVAPAGVTFTAANWSTAQTVTVTGINDDVDDGNVAYTIITAAASSTDVDYDGLNAADASVTNTDNDTAGITVGPTSGLVTTESGGTTTFTIVLNTQPTASVTIGLSSSDTTEGTVSPASVTFTAADWSTPQTVTVTGVNDDLDDGDVAYTVVTAPATSADANYSGRNASDVSVTNTDNDTAGVTVSPTSGLATTEAGGTAAFTIVLNGQPTANVTIGLSSSDTSEGTVSPASVTFTAANWNAPQSVTITGADDAVVNGDVPYAIVTAAAVSSDANYSGLNPSDIAVINSDNDILQLSLTINPTAVSEGAGTGAATGTVSHNSADLSRTWTITLSSSDPTEVAVPSQVTIPAGASSATFPLASVDDFLADGTQTVTIIASATETQGPPAGLDSSFGSGGLAPLSFWTTLSNANVPLAIQSDGKILAATQENSADKDSWRITRLMPNGSVDTTFGADGVVVTKMTASISTYPVPHKVLVQPDGKFLVGGQLSGGGLRGALARYNVNGSLDGTFGSGGIADWGFGVSDIEDLALRPDGKIVIALGVGGSLYFRAAQLNADGTVDTAFGMAGIATVPGVGSVMATSVELLGDGRIILAGDLTGSSKVARLLANGGLDTTFASGGVQTVDFGLANSYIAEMTIDSAGRIVVGGTASAGSNNSANAAAARLNEDGSLDTTFGVGGKVTTDFSGLDDGARSLVIQSDGKVVLAGSSEVADGTYHAALARCDASGVLDSAFDGDGLLRQKLTTYSERIHDAALQRDGKLLVTVGAGDDYRVARFSMGGTTPMALDANATLNVLDNDVAGFTVTPTSGLTTTEAGGSATFTIVLNTQPTADVTIGLNSDDTSEGVVSPASMTFTAANWNTAQTVTVTGVNDGLGDGDVAYTIVTAAAASADATYNGLNPADVSVTNRDNDGPGFTISALGAPTASEAGGTVTFTVRLTAQPTANVVINVSSSDTTEAGVSPASLTFTSADWNAEQTVTVTGVDDTLLDGDQAVTITAAVNDALSQDAFDPAPDQTRTVTITDYETLSVSFSPASISESGTATGTVTRSNTDNAAALTVNLTNPFSDRVYVPGTVTIPAGAASVTFTASGQPDDLLDGTQTATITASDAAAGIDLSFGTSGVAATSAKAENAVGVRGLHGCPTGRQDHRHRGPAKRGHDGTHHALPAQRFAGHEFRGQRHRGPPDLGQRESVSHGRRPSGGRQDRRRWIHLPERCLAATGFQWYRRHQFWDRRAADHLEPVDPGRPRGRRRHDLRRGQAGRDRRGGTRH